MSVRNIAKLLTIFWAFDVSTGGLTQAWRNLAATVRPVYDEIGEKIQNTAVPNADET